jgi:CheY-like chemotaxis protein
VADDEGFVRDIARVVLERDGFRVWLASQGLEAVELYREHQDDIAVVLLDVGMPGLDGPNALDAIRLINPDVRACFMSGGLGEYGREELLQRGASTIIDKPFKMDHLLGLIRWVAQEGLTAQLAAR